MAKRPNLVLLLADDLGYGDISALNPESRVRTPHHDRLAREGMVFTDGHSSSSVCTPSRYGIYTGRYCWRTWLTSGVLWGWSRPLIEASRPTIASVLRAAGYRTCFVGKWHLGLGWGVHAGADLGSDARAFPPEAVDYEQPLSAGPHTVGFDHSFAIPASLDMPPYCFIADGRVVEPPTARAEDSKPPDFWRAGPRSPGFEHGNCLLELTQRCEALIDLHARSRDDAPFLLVFSMTSPHWPHSPRAPFRGTTPMGPYGDLVAEHDWSVGRVLSALDRTGLARDTLVVATSDNCAQLHGLEERCGHRSNHHFRGQKSDAWDGGHRVPLIMRWPSGIRAGAECGALVSLTDLFATAASLAGATVPAGAGPDAVDLSPLFADPAGRVRDSAIQHSALGHFAVREAAWKLVRCRGSGGWTLPEDQVESLAPPEQLYELGGDVGETRNRWRELPEVAARLTGILERERARAV
jgi:arylsulfatase A-like enzyme